MAQRDVQARAPSCTRLMTFWFIPKLLGFAFTDTSNLKPLHLSCLAGVYAARLPVFHDPYPLSPPQTEFTAGGGGTCREAGTGIPSIRTMVSQSDVQPRRGPGQQSSLWDIEVRMLSMRLPNGVFDAIVIFEGTLPDGCWC